MLNPDEAVRQGILHHQQGRIDLAEPFYRQALSIAPNHGDALHLLGLVAIQCNRFDVAIELIYSAIQQKPNEHVYYGNLGVAFEKQGDKANAEAAFRHAIQLCPHYADGLNNLGQMLQSLGQLDEAERLLKLAIEHKPDHADAWNNLAVGAIKKLEFELAQSYCQHALSLQPFNSSARCNLGVALTAQNQNELALEQFRIALDLTPDSHLAHHGLATVRLKRGELDEAVAEFQKALAIDAHCADTWIHLGCALDELDKGAESIEALRRALELDPNSPDAYFNLGRVLSRCEQYAQSVDALDRSLELRPNNAEALSLLVNQLQNLCRWDRIETIAQRLITKVANSPIEKTFATGALVNPSSFVVLPIPTNWELQYRCARVWVMNKAPSSEKPWFLIAPSLDKPLHARVRNHSKIRVGYLSADFRAHVMASHMVELFEKHDREKFEVFGYSIGPNDGSSIRQRIEHAFDRFVDCLAMSPEAVAEKIAQDEMDILVDLQGHTLFSRPEILAKKPAPLQIAYLGFACTTGAEYIDYVLVDDFVAPAETQPYFTERLIQLPGCYQVNQTKIENLARIPTREECGLEEGSFVFCAFNALFKISPKMFDVWMHILKSVDRSVLWIPSHVPAAVENLRNEAAVRGIDKERLVFAPRISLAEHRARHQLANLFLDTFPYNAHGTASISLRCGVPIVTMAGSTMASRVAGSLLREVGLDELIASSYEEYAEFAIRLATNPSELERVRTTLAFHLENSSLFKCETFARNVERAYTIAFQQYRSGEAPKGFKLDQDGAITNLSHKHGRGEEIFSGVFAND